MVDRCGSMKGDFVQLLDLLIAWLPPLHGIFSRDIHPKRAEAREKILVDLEVRGKMRQTPPVSGKGVMPNLRELNQAIACMLQFDRDANQVRLVRNKGVWYYLYGPFHHQGALAVFEGRDVVVVRAGARKGARAEIAPFARLKKVVNSSSGSSGHGSACGPGSRGRACVAGQTS